ncbi:MULTISPECIES: ABC transporter substrate-binding protein [unclassified Vibrio]|uniref:ABC transporter substrate-binding protein n=1 Tax=unclassified Vibrio TaxID=2614977 RepID=UPI000C81DC82|nr:MULTISPECIES: ABC transporter substrate-binding protein [unclassified Vibrio]PMI97238.1 ABC transporter substrate-binding protein [Vibrio sp. 10N.286.45.E10]PTQ25565.1 ABC transporter substrate-binding protein [Vibrio sp. 10N.286.46.E10]
MNDANLRRLQQLIAKYEIGVEYNLTIDDLEHSMSTSRRNTSIVLKCLSEYHWICWIPSKGRGKLSQFRILVSFSEALEQVLALQLEQGRFNVIPRLLESYGVAAIKALTLATEKHSLFNQQHDHLLITQYPWVDNLEPANTYRTAEHHILRSLYNTLLVQDHEGRPQASLAHHWKMEGRLLHFWLRPNVLFHDGDILTAKDVAQCLLRLKNIDGPVQSLFEQVSDVQVVGDKQLTIELTHANPMFLYALSSPHASIYRCKRTYFSSGRSAYIGTGPFSLVDWSKERLVLKRHRGYFSQNALLEQITLTDIEGLNDHTLSFNKPGTVVLTQPRMTIPLLQDMADWLQQTITKTGVTIEVVELPNISDPSSMSELADLLFIEEVIEQPKEYGLYDWLLASSGLRFIFNSAEMKAHCKRVRSAASGENPINELKEIEQSLYQQKLLCPLFHGKEKVFNSVEVHGVEINQTGYSDFYKLWISSSEK